MYVSTSQAAEILNISTSRVRYLLAQGRVKGAYKVGRTWIIPLFEGNPIISRGSRGPKAKWCRRIPAKTKIHVNRNNIKKNLDQNLEDLIPVLSVKRSNSNVYGYSVKINGPCELIYRPEKPLDCGAVAWIETFSQVEVQLTKSNNKTIGEHSLVVNAA
ncbi:MAG: helix-turn-helix domain-containing protein [Cyanobacteria bacterium J06635_10]